MYILLELLSFGSQLQGHLLRTHKQAMTTMTIVVREELYQNEFELETVYQMERNQKGWVRCAGNFVPGIYICACTRLVYKHNGDLYKGQDLNVKSLLIPTYDNYLPTYIYC